MLMSPDKNTVCSIIKTAREIWSTAETPAGLLVRLSHDSSELVAVMLRASGYTVTEIDGRTVLVGGVDRLVLLEGQIAALTAERDALLDARRSAQLEDAMGGPF
ncbi:hypothetical protein [Nocardiopsis sp. L17-MgMaSL7]|uniref:hypothetical protein n=1 Tax=Nocardiopsis sp. L17-MgMaSL7 TaxID=1938893 RepID=UPI000D711BC3|nr:hypothetical protein [Nocardiopsis sp. L17-MgMaSL7]PWV44549.1 hypothetical protein BDW27_1238 [Nocardiopsis sp. L17-MgMaSL7]